MAGIALGAGASPAIFVENVETLSSKSQCCPSSTGGRSRNPSLSKGLRLRKTKQSQQLVPSAVVRSSRTVCMVSSVTATTETAKETPKPVAPGIEKEVAIQGTPDSLLRGEEQEQQSSESGSSSMRSRFEKMILAAQNQICAAVEEVDGSKFRQDAWTRPGGGGGISRVLQDGNVWEKAGVNVSVVYGTMPREAYRAATGNSQSDAGTANSDGRIPFFAAGISSVMHPKNPFAPTVHFNYRYFETDAPQDAAGAPRAWWFGGGTDLTPSYIFDEDARHFHQAQKDACDKHDPAFHPRFKQWCDDYFLIKVGPTTSQTF
eukprot:TRINITY_DN2652_c0_g1_i2.p1 TRINITY_DN2652_c0_g1~~TRINITY_DN2652_c0_g1_i2.p1  ORF type:complete len:318 (+),score=43.73 TRINITY_DN2652_c0_g1_i2:129-1082(+)